MENTDKEREKVIQGLISLVGYIYNQDKSHKSIIADECNKFFNMPLSKVKDMLENDSVFSMQDTKVVRKNSIYNKEIRISESKKNDYTTGIAGVQTKSNQKELEKNFVTKSEYECKVQQSTAQVQQLREQVQAITVQFQHLREQVQQLTAQVRQNTVQDQYLSCQIQQDKENIEEKSNNQPEFGIVSQTELKNNTEATTTHECNISEDSITLSQEMQKQMEDIIQNDSINNYGVSALRFSLKDAAEWSQHPRHFKNLDEAKKVPLRCIKGNAQFYGVSAKEEPYCFLVPVKNMVWSEKFLMEYGYEEFFQIDSSDDLKGNYKKIILKKPAIIEKRQDSLYYLVERGHIEVRN